MENYYLLAVICCLLPFIIGDFWFAIYDNPSTSALHASTLDFLTSPVVQGTEDIMLKEYSYSEIEPLNPFNKLLTELQKVNKYDPRDRHTEPMDIWYKNATKKLMHNGKCLAYIEHYGHLTDTFFQYMKELNLKPEQDAEFQKLLISVHRHYPFEMYCQNFSNLLFIYGKHWPLLPEIENILNADSRFEDARKTYCFARECAKCDQLKANS